MGRLAQLRPRCRNREKNDMRHAVKIRVEMQRGLDISSKTRHSIARERMRGLTPLQVPNASGEARSRVVLPDRKTNGKNGLEKNLSITRYS